MPADDDDARAASGATGEAGEAGETSEASESGESSEAGESRSSSRAASSAPDTDTEIARTTKSRKTLKRKRRATSPSRFGAALESLLDTAAPDGVPAPLSLKPGVARRHKEQKLERGARRVLDGERKEREERGRVRDVIGGWGVAGERALRKVAQRGVITLFNAIQQSQASAEEASAAARAARGSGRATLPAPDAERRAQGLDQDKFLDLIRGGGLVSQV